jgi:hypothetical protein
VSDLDSIFPFSVNPPYLLVLVRFSETKTEPEQSQVSREQDVAALSQARDAQRKSEVISQKAIGDIAKLGRALGLSMAGLGVTLGPMTPETPIEEVGRLPGVVRELELSTVQRAVHRVLAMFESHYQGLDRMALSGGWAPGISDDQCDELE